MKKLLLALSLILTMAIQSYAQTEFHWGFKGGINLTTYDSDCDDFQARVGQWGLLCRWNIGEHFAIQPECFYSKMGVRSLEKYIYWFPYHDSYYQDEDLLNVKFKLMLLTDNVQVPILFKYYVPLNLFGGPGLNIHAGPLFSQRFNWTISTPSWQGYLLDENLGNGAAPKTLRAIAHAQNQFTVQAVYGIGYDSPTGIGLDLRCQMGLTPVFDNKERHRGGQYNTNSHDRVWAIAFSYTF